MEHGHTGKQTVGIKIVKRPECKWEYIDHVLTHDSQRCPVHRFDKNYEKILR